MSDRSRRAALRERTAKAHASLDGSIGPFDSVENYILYLRGMAAFRIPLESSLSAAYPASSFGGWEHRHLADLIRLDLDDLGVDQVAAPAAPALVGRDALLGALYVLEGSALGARLLYKRAQELGLSAAFGARHLAAQAERGDRWPTFLALLETADAVEMEAVARSSDALFAAAEQAFSGIRQGSVR